VQVVARELVRFGTTAFCPTITTTDLNNYGNQSARLLEKFTDRSFARFLGFHFEGPALNPKKVGAQNAALLKTPREINAESYLASEALKLVTFAPELDGADELIASLRHRGIRIGIGHSIVSYDELLKVFDPSTMMMVHLFNAMEPLASREPGIVGAALANDAFIASIIPDGIHTHAAIISVIWKAKADKRKIICVSDGSAVAGLPPGTYQVGERMITRQEDRATLPGGTLVGSVLTLDQAVRNLIKFTGCGLSEAVNSVTLNPAAFLGIETTIGQIAVGRRADLVVLDADLFVMKTFVDGRLRYENDVRRPG